MFQIALRSRAGSAAETFDTRNEITRNPDGTISTRRSQMLGNARQLRDDVANMAENASDLVAGWLRASTFSCSRSSPGPQQRIAALTGHRRYPRRTNDAAKGWAAQAVKRRTKPLHAAVRAWCSDGSAGRRRRLGNDGRHTRRRTDQDSRSQARLARCYPTFCGTTKRATQPIDPQNTTKKPITKALLDHTVVAASPPATQKANRTVDERLIGLHLPAGRHATCQWRPAPSIFILCWRSARGPR